MLLLWILPGCGSDKLRPCTRHYDDGSLKYEVMCDGNGRYQGEYREYHKDGKLWKTKEYVDNVEQGTTRYYFHNSGNVLKEIPMVAGKRHGEVRTFREDGTLEKLETYEAGKKTGPQISYYETGTPREIVTYQDSMSSGLYQFFSTDSVLLVDGELHKGRKFGRWDHYDYDGDRLARLSFYNDQLNGDFQVWDEAGNPLLSGAFKDDVLHGDLKYLSPSGETRSVLSFLRGRLQQGPLAGQRRFLNEPGKLIMPTPAGPDVYIMPDTVWLQ